MESWLVFLLISLTCLSCPFRSNATVALDQPTTTKHQKDAVMLSTNCTQGLPDSLKAMHPLWEVDRKSTYNSAGWIARLYENGQLYTWSNTRFILVDGMPRREPAPYAWRLDAQLTPEGVKRVQDLIRAEFTKLPVNGSFATAADQGTVVRRSYIDGVEHRIELPNSGWEDLPKVIQDIDDAINSAIIPGAVPLKQ
ncbi:hypothetical protein NIES4074_26700 [Cylindrospermum sp. NIES-4074]|nr:hypothetical protein NIES4074_26700 [Cylindrospermum sp. NIES-4074]